MASALATTSSSAIATRFAALRADGKRALVPYITAGDPGIDETVELLKGLEDGARTRAEMLEFINGYTGDGLSKSIAFDENGDVPKEQVSYWAYKNVGGTLEPEVEVKPAS